MGEFILSRIQHRRGKRSDLPQPLENGELGWCEDTHELYIGTNPENSPNGIELYSNAPSGSEEDANSVLKNQIIETTTVGTFENEDDWEAVRQTILDSLLFTFSQIALGSTIVYDEQMIRLSNTSTTPSGYKFTFHIGLYEVYILDPETSEIDTTRKYNSILYNGIRALPEIADAYYYGEAVDLFVNGELYVSSVTASGNISWLINKVWQHNQDFDSVVEKTGLVTTKQNIKIVTDMGQVAITGQYILQDINSLPPGMSVADLDIDGDGYVDTGLSYNTLETDTFSITYSVATYDETDSTNMAYLSSGVMTITAIPASTRVSMTDDTQEVRDDNSINDLYTAGPDINFKAIIDEENVGGTMHSVVRVLYKHNFDTPMMLHTTTTKWQSFVG